MVRKVYALKLDDIFAAPQVSRDIVQELPANFYASDWTYTHGNLFSAIQMEKAMVSLLLFLNRFGGCI